jgi:hypothetical protein
MSEEHFITSGRGKWSQIGVPHRGWLCIEVEDLDEPAMTCEMCESSSIRYVHHMQHPDHEAVLRVGCVCAGHMEGDLTAATAREAGMTSRGAKRKRWLTRKWRVSRKGNAWLNADGYRVTIFPKGTLWAASVAFGDSHPRFCRRAYQTEEAAKLSAFDFITRLETARVGK